jgi:hypothetical protein
MAEMSVSTLIRLLDSPLSFGGSTATVAIDYVPCYSHKHHANNAT